MAKTNDETKLYKEALNRWGDDKQIGRCFEKSLDLAKALLAMILNRKDFFTLSQSYINVYQAIGELEVMLGQMKHVFPASEIEKYKNHSLRALAKELGFQWKESGLEDGSTSAKRAGKLERV